jgi:hypothetical protein
MDWEGGCNGAMQQKSHHAREGFYEHSLAFTDAPNITHFLVLVIIIIPLCGGVRGFLCRISLDVLCPAHISALVPRIRDRAYLSPFPHIP